MALLGQGALILALLLAVYATATAFWAGSSRDRRTLLSARNALVGVLVAVLIADAIFLYAILTHDFSFRVVASSTSLSLPTIYLITSFWSSQAGSLLLWVTVLIAASVVAVYTTRRALAELQPYLIGVLGLVTAFFTLLLVVPASPFVTQIAPADGVGLNPSLQNPYMATHPPALYLGYVGLTIPFALAIAALMSGRLDARWLVASRRWTLAAWGFLGVGMLLGAHWAYTEIGWGGFWAWDPVENAALMPWLVATAFLHSVMVQERKGMLKVWNMALISGAFALVLFGTFLTRSGILSSVHSFVASDIGWYFLIAIALTLGGSFGLILWRLPQLRADQRLESLASREATFLFNNLLFVGLAFAVLWGVLFPLVTEAIGQVRQTVASPFYEFFAIAFGIPLLLLMGIGPLIAWRRASLSQIKTTFVWPFVAGVLAGGIMLLFGLGSSWPGVAALSVCAFTAATIVGEFVRGTRARRRIAEESTGAALVHLVGKNRRRYGGYIVHVAIIVFAIGAVGSSAYESRTQGLIAPGQSLQLRDDTLTFTGIERSQGPNYTQRSAVVEVTRGGEAVTTLRPAQRDYAREQITTNEVAIQTTLTGGNLFLVLDGVSADGSAAIQAFYKPVVTLIWLSGVIFVLGLIIAGWPDRRAERRVARRYAEDAPAREREAV